jgi:uncharacterized membrane protein YeiH
MQKSLALGFNPVISIMMGVVSAVMGGVLRDTFVNDIPLIFRKEIYATACIVGALLFLLLSFLNVNAEASLLFTIILIISIRLIAIKFQLRLPVITSRQP